MNDYEFDRRMRDRIWRDEYDYDNMKVIKQKLKEILNEKPVKIDTEDTCRLGTFSDEKTIDKVEPTESLF